MWASAPDEGVVWRIEPGGQRVPIAVGTGVIAVAFGEGALWAANYADGTIARIDPATNEVTTQNRMPGNVQGIAAGEGSAWVSVGRERPAGPLSTSACGQPESGGKSPDLLIASDFPLQGAAGFGHAYDSWMRSASCSGGMSSRPVATPSATSRATTRRRRSAGWSLVKCVSNARAYGAARQVVAVIGPLQLRLRSVGASDHEPGAHRPRAGDQPPEHVPGPDTRSPIELAAR